MRQPSFATAAVPFGILAAVALSTIALSAQVPAAAQAGFTSPRPITQVKPKYTVDAMRARVEGTARVICIVEPDGTVGAARISQSLDAVTGLDEEAIKSVKQWKFRPGTKDGAPVAVQVSIDVQFSLRGDSVPVQAPRPSDPAALLALPRPFVTATDPASWDTEPWTTVVKDVPGVRVRASYPSTWIAKSADSPDALLQLQDGALLLRLDAKPAAATEQPDAILSATSLLTMEEDLRHTVGDAGEVMAVGQASVSNHLWKWTDVSSSRMAGFSLPPIMPLDPAVYDRMRMWVLSSLVGSENISVDCTFVYLSTDPSTPENMDHAAADCGGLLKHISIEPR